MVSSSPLHAPPGAGMVLVVDDEPLAAQVTSRMLHEGGYTTVEVRSAREALSVLELARPGFDVVVTDVVMPETDGRTLGRLIAERHPRVPVIYVSAYPQNDVFHRGAPDPLSLFLQKPFEADTLLAVVRQVLTTKST
jgi:CheY-like chemotaxis protein